MRTIELDLKPHEVMRVYRERKFTQQGLALEVDCSQMQISRIERGLLEPSTQLKRLIEQKLGVIIWKGVAGKGG